VCGKIFVTENYSDLKNECGSFGTIKISLYKSMLVIWLYEETFDFRRMLIKKKKSMHSKFYELSVSILCLKSSERKSI
jgi:hypothetical protein